MKDDFHFHVAHEDYFGTLATILDLYRQIGRTYSDAKKEQFFKKITEELMFLQEHYKIIGARILATRGRQITKRTRK